MSRELLGRGLATRLLSATLTMTGIQAAASTGGSSTRSEARRRRALRGSRPRPAAPSDRTLFEEWRRAARSGPPFLTADFFLQTADLLGETPLVVFGGRAESPMFLPLYQRGRELFSLRSDQSPRYDLCGDPVALPRAWQALQTSLGWDTLTLRGVPVTSPLVRVLPGLARADGCRVEMQRVGCAPFLQLADLERDLDDRFGCALAELEQGLPQPRYERITAADPEAIDCALELDASDRKREVGTARVSDPHLRAFYQEFARVCAHAGRLDLAFLEIGGRRVASHFAVEDDHTHYVIKSDCDPEYARLGVAHLLVREAALDARRRGLRRFDFVVRDGDWKPRWTRSGLPHVELRLYRPTVRGRLRYIARERVSSLRTRIVQSIGVA